MSLIDYAKTARQREAIKAWEECGEVAVNAAALLGRSSYRSFYLHSGR
jgi:hypothetical protein